MPIVSTKGYRLVGDFIGGGIAAEIVGIQGVSPITGN